MVGVILFTRGMAPLATFVSTLRRISLGFFFGVITVGDIQLVGLSIFSIISSSSNLRTSSAILGRTLNGTRLSGCTTGFTSVSMFRSTFTPFILPMPSNVSLNFPNSSYTVDGSVSTMFATVIMPKSWAVL